MPAITGIAHVELSVRDLDVSEAWYVKVFGMRTVWAGRDEGRQFSDRAVRDPHSGVVLGLTQHRANSGERFLPNRTGLDHLSFVVADRDELRAWQERLAELGVDYTPLEEWTNGAAVTARDPDGIAIEFIVRGAAPA